MRRFVLTVLIPGLVFPIWHQDSFPTINRWRSPVYNYGMFGIDIARGNIAGAYWPYPLRNYYIFGGGLWVGSLLENETLATIGYNPNSGSGEFVPAIANYWRGGYQNPLDRIYKYPIDWPPPLSRFPQAPQTNRSQEDIWCCFGDSDQTRHFSPGYPLGVDLFLTGYAWSDTQAQDIFFLKYEIKNISNATLNNLYFGLVLDADIGDYRDDMTGLILNKRFTLPGGDTIRVKDVGFAYDYDNIENPGELWQSGTPGAVAIRFLRTPRGLGLTAFKKFTIEIDPLRDNEQYLTLAGFNYRTGIYEPYDSIDLTPGDKRFLMSCGPFNLLPESTEMLVVAVIGAAHGDSGEIGSKSDTTELGLACYRAELVYQRILGIEEQERGLSLQPKVLQVSPNPFRDGVMIRFNLKKREPVRIAIYDVSGRVVHELLKRELDLGDYRLTWNVKNEPIPSGIYFIRLETSNSSLIRPITLIKN